MKYKNGREAKLGDQIVGKDTNGQVVGGILVKASQRDARWPNDSAIYDGSVMPAARVNSFPIAILSECLHVDDAFPNEEGTV